MHTDDQVAEGIEQLAFRIGELRCKFRVVFVEINRSTPHTANLPLRPELRGAAVGP